MAVYRAKDPDYWGRAPAALKGLVNAAPRAGIRASIHTVAKEDADPPVVALLERPAGSMITRHAHPGARVEVVVAGSLHADGVVLGPGDILTSGPQEFYGPYLVGPEGCTSAEFFSAASHLYSPSYEGGDNEARSMDFLGALDEALDQARVAREASQAPLLQSTPDPREG